MCVCVYILSQTSKATLNSFIDILLNISYIFINFTLNVPKALNEQMKEIVSMKVSG